MLGKMTTFIAMHYNCSILFELLSSENVVIRRNILISLYIGLVNDLFLSIGNQYISAYS